jgi:hypothetical protein
VCGDDTGAGSLRRLEADRIHLRHGRRDRWRRLTPHLEGLLSLACFDLSSDLQVRALGYDYEDGSGRNYPRYDLTQQGPLARIAISF